LQGVAGIETHLEKKVLKAAEQDRPDVAQQRAEWKVWQAELDPEQLVFIDETWAKTNMTRPRGRSPKGTRVIAKVPHGHWKTTTFLAALRTSGLTAPLVVDGAINGELFLAYVRQQLVPTLRVGDIVIMDNLASHKKPGVRVAIESVGASVLYLPPYSPDLNPIENAFSKFKWLLKSSAERTVAALWTRCGELLNTITATESRNYFRHCGYRQSYV
jgi:transposase